MESVRESSEKERLLQVKRLKRVNESAVYDSDPAENMPEHARRALVKHRRAAEFLSQSAIEPANASKAAGECDFCYR